MLPRTPAVPDQPNVEIKKAWIMGKGSHGMTLHRDAMLVDLVVEGFAQPRRPCAGRPGCCFARGPNGAKMEGRACGWAGSTMKETLKAGVLYFALEFAAGFVLGTIRTLCVVPRLGVRTAELVEAPMMFCISILAARRVVRRLQVSPLRSRRLAVGCIALGLMLVAEFTLGLWIRGTTIREYFEARDPVSGAVYFMTRGAFAVIRFCFPRTEVRSTVRLKSWRPLGNISRKTTARSDPTRNPQDPGIPKR
jgi:hypothetical protein